MEAVQLQYLGINTACRNEVTLREAEEAAVEGVVMRRQEVAVPAMVDQVQGRQPKSRRKKTYSTSASIWIKRLMSSSVEGVKVGNIHTCKEAMRITVYSCWYIEGI
jgi:hypothetical protein